MIFLAHEAASLVSCALGQDHLVIARDLGGWQALLEEELAQPYFKDLEAFLEEERRAGRAFAPEESEIFRALRLTSPEDVRVVIIGQDPYHGEGQAMGLAFSVPDGVKLPPSLVNIFKELEQDLGKMRPESGDLSRWADQGVLLLNSVLSVRLGEAASHAGRGWERFTDALIFEISKERRDLVFLLWGRYAQEKAGMVHAVQGHRLLASAHPSPLSASRGFFGSRPFSRANQILGEKGLGQIDW